MFTGQQAVTDERLIYAGIIKPAVVKSVPAALSQTTMPVIQAPRVDTLPSYTNIATAAPLPAAVGPAGQQIMTLQSPVNTAAPAVPAGSSNNWILIAAAATVLLLLTSKKKRKK